MVFSWPHEAFEATFGASGLRAVKGPILRVRPANLNPVPPESSTNAPPPPLLPSLPHLPLSLPCHCTNGVFEAFLARLSRGGGGQEPTGA